MSSKKIVITGGAGFVGTNLIKLLLKKTSYKLISIDDYSSSTRKNHIKNSRVKYINAHTKNISAVLNPKQIHSIFHFGEFARIYQSFLQMDKCIESNSIGTNAVFNFCLKNKIKLIYSATSASLGNKGNDKNLSPYAFTKAKNLEMLENLNDFNGKIAGVIDFVGNEKTANLALSIVKKGGTIVIVGLYGGSLSISLPLIPMRSINIKGSYVGELRELKELVELINSKNVELIKVTKQDLNTANDAMKKLRNGDVDGRIVLEP